MALRDELVGHDGPRDDRIDFDRRDIAAAGGEGSRNVIAAARAEDQGLGARPDQIRNSRTFVGELEAIRVTETIPIEWRDAGGCVGVDHDAPLALKMDAHAGETVPGHESFRGQPLAFGIADVQEEALEIDHHKTHQQQRHRHRRGAPSRRTCQVEPDCRRYSVEHRGRDHSIRSAENIQERNEHQAACRGARQVEEIRAIHAFDCLGNRQRRHRAGEKERQRGDEIDHRQRSGSEAVRPRKNEPQRGDHRQPVGDRHGAEFRKQVAAPRRDDV